MFQRLQQKWKVNGLHLALILCTFAIGGSLTGFVGRKLMNLFPLEQGWLWIVVYILVVTIVWPFAVLLVSLPFGQYRFFTGYLKKMGKRMGIRSQRPEVGRQKSDLEFQTSGNEHQATSIEHGVIRIAIFASGAGSNAQKIIDHFENSDNIIISLIVCNKPGAGVLSIADKENIPSLLIDKEKFF